MMKRILLLLLLIFNIVMSNAQTNHIVQRGETLDIIAGRYGISSKSIREANPLIDEYYVGITLSIPPKPKPVVTSTTKNTKQKPHIVSRRERHRSRSVNTNSQSSVMGGGYVGSYQPVYNPFIVNEQLLWQSQHSQLQSSLNTLHNQMMQSAQMDFNNFMQQQIQQTHQFDIQGRILQQQFINEATANWNNSMPIINTSSYVDNTSTSTSTKKTKVSKECPYCSKGETIQHESVSTFGLDGPRVHCNICNKSWNYGTVHVHRRCKHCEGTGRYQYEY